MFVRRATSATYDILGGPFIAASKKWLKLSRKTVGNMRLAYEIGGRNLTERCDEQAASKDMFRNIPLKIKYLSTICAPLLVHRPHTPAGGSDYEVTSP